MWNPEEYYRADGPVFRSARGMLMAGAEAGPSGRAGTAVPTSLVGALPDPGAQDCRDAVLRVECTLEALALAAHAVMRAPAAGARQRSTKGRKTAEKGRGPAKAGCARGPLVGGMARAFVFQVLSTLGVMRRLQRAVRRAVGDARAVDMAGSYSLGALL